MILGLGNDIIDIRRLERLYLEYGDRLQHLLFTEFEWLNSLKKPSPVAFLAKRFAAKEAFVKALGVGFGQEAGILWRDIEVINNELGRPDILLYGRANLYMDTVLKKYKANRYKVNLSLSDEFPYAIAGVIISLEHC